MNNQYYLPTLLGLIFFTLTTVAQTGQRPSAEFTERRQLLNEASKIKADKGALESSRADVSIRSIGDLAMGYYAGSEIVMIELTAFPEGGEENSQYYFKDNQLFLVSTTINEYTENLFSFDESDEKSTESIEGGKINDEGEFVADWDWGMEVDSTRQVDKSWTDPSLSMFSAATTEHFFFETGRLKAITDQTGKELERELDFYVKMESELIHNAVKMREALSRQR